MKHPKAKSLYPRPVLKWISRLQVHFRKSRPGPYQIKPLLEAIQKLKPILEDLYETQETIAYKSRINVTNRYLIVRLSRVCGILNLALGKSTTSGSAGSIAIFVFLSNHFESYTSSCLESYRKNVLLSNRRRRRRGIKPRDARVKCSQRKAYIYATISFELERLLERLSDMAKLHLSLKLHKMELILEAKYGKSWRNKV